MATGTSLHNIRTMNQLAASVRNNPEVEKQFKENPSKVLDEIASRGIPNTRVYQIVVVSLGAAILVALVGAIAIALTGQTDQIPDILVAIASASVGALAGLLAPQPQNGG